MNVLKYIDYIWFAGESFHRREKAPGDGNALVMWCWYPDVLFPFLFCRLRYTEKRRNEILEKYQGRRTGRELLLVWSAMIGICCLEGFLMFCSGFWK